MPMANPMTPERPAYCARCGATLAGDALFCHRCGRALSQPPVPAAMPPPIYPAYPPPYAPMPFGGYIPFYPVRPPPPVPRDRRPFAAGLVGEVFLAFACIAVGASMILLFLTGSYYSMPEYPLLQVLAHEFAAVSLVFVAIGQLGYYTNFRSGLGLATFITAIVGAILLAVLIPAGVRTGQYYTDFPPYRPSPGYRIDLAIWALGYIPFGVALILLGAGRAAFRRFSRTDDVSSASAVLYILAGSFCCTFVLGAMFPVAWFLLIPAVITSAFVSKGMATAPGS